MSTGKKSNDTSPAAKTVVTKPYNKPGPKPKPKVDKPTAALSQPKSRLVKRKAEKKSGGANSDSESDALFDSSDEEEIQNRGIGSLFWGYK
jgi:hypothetical protein